MFAAGCSSQMLQVSDKRLQPGEDQSLLPRDKGQEERKRPQVAAGEVQVPVEGSQGWSALEHPPTVPVFLLSYTPIKNWLLHLNCLSVTS